MPVAKSTGFGLIQDPDVNLRRMTSITANLRGRGFIPIILLLTSSTLASPNKINTLAKVTMEDVALSPAINNLKEKLGNIEGEFDTTMTKNYVRRRRRLQADHQRLLRQIEHKFPNHAFDNYFDVADVDSDVPTLSVDSERAGSGLRKTFKNTGYEL